jgi:hypothetical protein
MGANHAVHPEDAELVKGDQWAGAVLYRDVGSAGGDSPGVRPGARRRTVQMLGIPAKVDFDLATEVIFKV